MSQPPSAPEAGAPEPTDEQTPAATGHSPELLAQVAALAGLPKAALQQARARLAELEAQNRDAPSVPMSAPALDQPQQFGLFAPQSAALDALAAIDPDDLTPKQALEALYRLKTLT